MPLVSTNNVHLHYQVRERKNEISITLPTLILAGKNDIFINPETSKSKLFEKILGAQLHLFENCGHMLQREKPKAFAELILSFGNNT